MSAGPPDTVGAPAATQVSGLAAELIVPGRLAARVDAAPGEVVAVVGPNGAGKTTLLQAIAGLVPAAGEITLDGHPVTGPARDRHLGVVFQQQLLFGHLTARDNVAFGPRARGVPRREADRTATAWLERLGVGELADRRPGRLSGGQAQRVAIARALATEPRLLLLDEPVAGLDVRVATALRIELTRHLAAFPGVTLLVTHDPVDALTLADRVLVLDEGHVAQRGTPAEVAQHPRTPHVARLVGLNLLRDREGMLAFGPETVTVDTREPGGSARLRWYGEVLDVTPHGDVLRLVCRAHRAYPGEARADLPDGDPGADLIADVTPQAAAELDLVPGRRVWLAVKEQAVRRYPAGPLGDTAPGPF